MRRASSVPLALSICSWFRNHPWCHTKQASRSACHPHERGIVLVSSPI